MKDTIYLHNIQTASLIGILPHERHQAQTLIISIECETDFTAAAESDDVNDAVSYAALADLVADFAANADFGLLETFACALIEAVFAEFNVSAVTLTVQKPGAVAATREAGIKLRRER